MLFRRLVHQPQFLFERPRAKYEDHDEGVREADFCSVDGAIAGGFDDGEERGEVGVEDYGFDCFLRGCQLGCGSDEGARADLEDVHLSDPTVALAPKNAEDGSQWSMKQGRREERRQQRLGVRFGGGRGSRHGS